MPIYLPNTPHKANAEGERDATAALVIIRRVRLHSGIFPLVGCLKKGMDLSTSGYETTNSWQGVGGLRWQPERLSVGCISGWAYSITSNCCGAGDSPFHRDHDGIGGRN